LTPELKIRKLRAKITRTFEYLLMSSLPSKNSTDSHLEIRIARYRIFEPGSKIGRAGGLSNDPIRGGEDLGA